MALLRQFSVFCIGLCLCCGGLQARVYESKWFSIKFPDDWTLYETSKIAENDGVGGRYDFKDGAMGLEACSSWGFSLNIPFLSQTLDQSDSQQKIKEFVLKGAGKHCVNVEFTKLAVITVEDEQCVEVQWNAIVTKKCRLPVPLGQRVFFSQCFIPSTFNWGNYVVLGYSTQWNENVQSKISSVRSTFRRCVNDVKK